ncbi:hypothetical protein VI817_004141 [Penicillium citrinum]|nr:hypothetical protein VI817_004141 [Penicillium citrinum]
MEMPSFITLATTTPEIMPTKSMNDKELESFITYMHSQHHGPNHVAPNIALNTGSHFLNWHINQEMPQTYLQHDYPMEPTNDQGQSPLSSASLGQANYGYDFPMPQTPPVLACVTPGPCQLQYVKNQLYELPITASASLPCSREASPECSLRVVIEDPTNPKPCREKRTRTEEERSQRKEDAQRLKAMGGACSSCHQCKKKCGLGTPCPQCLRTGKTCIRRSPNSSSSSDNTPPSTPHWPEGNSPLQHCSYKGKMKQIEIAFSSPRYEPPFEDAGASFSKPETLDYRDRSVSPASWTLAGLYDDDDDDDNGLETRLWWALLRSTTSPPVVV